MQTPYPKPGGFHTLVTTAANIVLWLVLIFYPIVHDAMGVLSIMTVTWGLWVYRAQYLHTRDLENPKVYPPMSAYDAVVCLANVAIQVWSWFVLPHRHWFTVTVGIVGMWWIFLVWIIDHQRKHDTKPKPRFTMWKRPKPYPKPNGYDQIVCGLLILTSLYAHYALPGHFLTEVVHVLMFGWSVWMFIAIYWHHKDTKQAPLELPTPTQDQGEER